MKRKRRVPRGVPVGVALLMVCACSRDVRLAGRKLRNVTVGTKTHYGITLDKNATPDQVAFVLLRAIREDFAAKTRAEREAALDIQFDLAAANVLQTHNRNGMDRDEHLYNVVYRWTPTVSHYGGDLETDWERARTRLAATAPKPPKDSADGAMECEVFMELNDPSGDPNARVVLIVWMAQDSGYWRVTHLGFDPTRREVRSKNSE